MADWNNETDSIVIRRKCVNANSDPSGGVYGTKQGNNARQSNQYNNLQNWIGGKVEVKAEASIIAMRALLNIHSHSRYRNIEPFLNIVLNFDAFHPILDSDIDKNYDHAKIDA
jgi:hypothetical protein